MNDSNTFAYHVGLAEKVRAGTWKDHCRSTYDMFEDHVGQGRFNDAAELALYTLHEAREPVDLYLVWLPQIRTFLEEHGVCNATVVADEQALLARIAPAGQTFDPNAGWERVCKLAEDAALACKNGNGDDATAKLEASRIQWHDTHDRLCDWVQGLIAIVARRIGEDSIGELWQLLMSPMFESYEKYDMDATPWDVSAEILLQVTAMALRGHLSGPGRRGEIEFVEETDRVGFRFSPCGSGGRNYSDETFDEFPLTTKPYDWAWNTEGICLYCAHCCALSEINPIQRFGYPARVVEPPFTNRQGRRNHCTWWVYKHPDLVPAGVYQRTGHAKPKAFGGKATRGSKSSPQSTKVRSAKPE